MYAKSMNEMKNIEEEAYFWVLFNRSHYNSSKLEKCHYNPGILKHAIIILGVAGAGHCLRM